jgi:hypothetical protein
MFLTMLFDQPQMIGAILRGTPVWVWVLLAALLSIGFSQTRDREASLARVSVMPLVMTAFSIYGTVSAFGKSNMFGYTMMAWMLAAAATFAFVAMRPVARGTVYHPATRTFALPGTWMTLGLIAAIFLTRYFVNIDIAINPALARDGQYTLVVGTLFGVFSGMFIGRAARLWRIAAEGHGIGFMLQRDPW